ncbi:MAG: sigma 54-interacting transcriptional regulator [Bacillota bacterium]|nr:sigma 54-interacting transcriptional regulator [Bacillota bacterium]
MKISEVPNKYLALIETILSEFDGALIIDEQGIIRVFTDYYARETGFCKEEVLGKRVDEIFPTTRMLEVLNSGKPIIADVWELGGKMQIVSRVPIISQGKIIGAAGFNIFRYMDDARGFADRISKMFAELEYHKEQVKRLSAAKYSMASIIGTSDGIMESKERVLRVASSSIPVTIYGETGTGKELFAHAVHQESTRKEYPFIRVNCAAIPDNLVESELFGYEDGAFTGARKNGKPGKFELAHRGSILLDEVSDLPYASQARLLRVLQEKEVERVGGTRTIPLDVRIISSTNLPLQQLVAEKRFRKDLYFRLDVFPIIIPPLRMRLTDIPLLCDHFIQIYNQEGGGVEGIDSKALELLKTYHWPGNVRELQTVIERACISAGRDVIRPEHLLRFSGREQIVDNHYNNKSFDIQAAKQETEMEMIKRALEQSGGNKSAAAKSLGISRSTLYDKLKQLGL